jgi:hypothetical protein
MYRSNEMPSTLEVSLDVLAVAAAAEALTAADEADGESWVGVPVCANAPPTKPNAIATYEKRTILSLQIWKISDAAASFYRL